MTIRWERRDKTVITVITETSDGYLIALVDQETGDKLLGPRPAKINRDKLVGYGFKQVKRRVA